MNNQIKEDHYVYRLIYNNNVIYVGEGRVNRKRDKYKRPTKLKELWESCTVEVVATGLTKQQSTEIESELIVDEMIAENIHLLNSHSGKRTVDYNYETLSAHLQIDTKSDTYICWLDGSKAGCISKQYYPEVCINYVSYLISRVVWVLWHKESIDSTYVVHHIDGNPLNNHPNNLMKVTYTENNIMRESRKPREFNWYSKISRKGNRFKSSVRLLSGKIKEITVRIDEHNPELSAEICSKKRNELVTNEFLDYPHLIPYLISVKL